MRYVICHGEYPKDDATFGSTATIYIYVDNVGDALSQSKAVDILLMGTRPTRELDRKKCPDLRLTPIEPHERFALDQALGSVVQTQNVHFLSGSTPLSDLVAQLNDNEIRLITCTVGGPTQGHSSDKVAQGKFEGRATGLYKARQASADRAKAYIAELKDAARAMWLADEVMYGIMTEWAVAALPPITDQIDSWADTLAYLTARPGLLKDLYFGGSLGFPDYGKDVRARIDAVNTHLTQLPACVGRMNRAYHKDPKYEGIRQYVQGPVGGGATEVTRIATIMWYELWPVITKANEMRTVAGPVGWHGYLQVLGALDNEKRSWLAVILDLPAQDAYIVAMACASTDFGATWRDVVTNYAATVEPFLRASTDNTLRHLIGQAATPAVQPVPAVVTTTVTTTDPLYKARCAACQDTRDHREATDRMDDTSADQRCPGCVNTIGSADEVTTLACLTCNGVCLVHVDCLASIKK